MRPLKFRARINEKGRAEHLAEWQHFTLDDLLDGHARELDERIDRKTIGQFTGLHDKNGKEIWEGDKLAQEGRTEAWIVQWNKPFGCFGLVYTGCKLQTIPFFESYLEMMEVIGDIFEGGE